MMKRIMFLAVIVLITLSFSVGANAAIWTGIYGVRVAGDRDTSIDLASWFTTSPSSTGMVANSGAASTAAGAPNNWGAYISANVPVVGVRSGTYSNALNGAGYYQAFTTFAATTSGKTNAKFITTSATGTDTTYVDQTVAGGNVMKWMSLGIHKYGASNALVTLTNDNQSTSGSLYLHSIKYESMTPGAVTGTGLGNGGIMDTLQPCQLDWAAGLYDSSFSVFFGTTSGSLSQIAGGLGETDLSCDLEGLLSPGSQYFWRVDATNVGVTTAGTQYSFTTKTVPEPSSMLAFATGLVGLFGIIRRKRA